jgi:ankyrin repeat protein
MKNLLGETLQALALLAVPVLAMAHPTRSRKRLDPALCDAASAGDVARLRALLADGVSADSADEDGTTALMAGAFAGERRVVELLLDHGADPNLQDDSGLTALMNAVIGDGEMDLEGAHSVFLDIIELLLNAGADSAVEDENGATACDHAALYELDEIARLLAARSVGC